jgi:hypothetical protein
MPMVWILLLLKILPQCLTTAAVVRSQDAFNYHYDYY